MGGAASKRKGSAGEREAASLLIGWALPLGIKLDMERNLSQSRGGGHDLDGLEPYGLSIEVKRQEAVAMNSWWSQTVRQAERLGCVPVLMWRQNRKPWGFRVRVWVHPARKPLDVDMTAEVFRDWYQAYLKHQLERIEP